uniref:Succinate dehydrogenase assembly factor 4, mitochondrial n=1 Tax=Spumella elongata TaxID=89044 RepID=A0A7S3GRS8_9STRA|mmetsp:Transcript_15886/g.27951  ORF Transcript_15886/g.27951 Transcript_15886/m.27951 type:complete len:113 (+) Transcript_15886:109-447(+)|eukprot:CAMPEP_0184980110 /NCGR_PEP_ID=MMETSP1098-20130426/10140_1 /TAXON_ID=89044 /ORGANISM="Spumella elongata, Strain CCAP 955/1" /LENGTH=112 /DNA_ID=CAMNT_0027503473 /DNA_START=57 /DNA_END=395 /DNA_ORIENTATION=+
MRRVILSSVRVGNVIRHNQRFATTVQVDHTKAPKKESLEAVKFNPAANKIAGKEEAASKCGPEDDPNELDEMEEMFIEGPAGLEWNGPTRGGKRPEPTRFGDWERKGRASDF